MIQVSGIEGYIGDAIWRFTRGEVNLTIDTSAGNQGLHRGCYLEVHKDWSKYWYKCPKDEGYTRAGEGEIIVLYQYDFKSSSS